MTAERDQLAALLETTLAGDDAQIIKMLGETGVPIPDGLRGNIVYPAAQAAADAVLEAGWLPPQSGQSWKFAAESWEDAARSASANLAAARSANEALLHERNTWARKQADLTDERDSAVAEAESARSLMQQHENDLLRDVTNAESRLAGAEQVIANIEAQCAEPFDTLQVEYTDGVFTDVSVVTVDAIRQALTPPTGDPS